MQIIPQTKSRVFNNGTVFKAFMYDTEGPEISTARLEINGRHPQKGSMRNTAVRELIYVIEADGEVTINKQTHKVNAGDVILLEAGEPMYWNGKFSIVVSCSPAWNADQHEFLDE